MAHGAAILKVMQLQERVRLARLAYIRAVAAARMEPTSAAWGRLLTAAKNLNEATRDRERGLRPRGEPLGA